MGTPKNNNTVKIPATIQKRISSYFITKYLTMTSILNAPHFVMRLLAILIVSIFVSNYTGVILVDSLYFKSEYFESLSDSIVLILFLLPILYWLVYVPFMKEIKKFEVLKVSSQLSDLKLNTAFSTSPDAIFLSKAEGGKLININKGTSVLTGYTEEELLRDYPKKIKLWKNQNDRQELLNKLKTDGFVTNFETQILLKNKTSIDILVSASLIQINNVEHLFIIAKDISYLKHIERKIIKSRDIALESEKKFKDIVENISEWIWSVDENNILTYSNPVIKEILGYSAKEIIGKKYFDFLTPEDLELNRPNLLKFKSQKKGWKNFIIKCKHINGSIRNINSSASPIINDNGELIGYRGIARDITEILKSRQELINAKEKAEESDQLKTEFLRNMFHEIRTPLNGILGFSGFLSDPDLETKKRENFVKIIQNSSNQLMHIINDILEISELETKQVKIIKTEVCLNDLFLELFSVFDIKAKEHKIPLYLKKGLSDTESTILTDKTKLLKVLNNLLENALKFTTEGFIEFGYSVKAINDTVQLLLYVKDSGVGIDPEKHKMIFERFAQAEKDLAKNVGGLGLGLSIAKENAELLGGKIEIESELNKGATFLVMLPYIPTLTIEKTKTDKPKYSILIAEDEETNYIYLQTILLESLKLNCNIFHAKNGLEAVEICKSNATINLVLMDLKMPEMNGFEATRQLKKIFPSLPIIAQTAYSTKEDKEKAFSAGCDDFISKPLNVKQLINLIPKYLANSISKSY